MTVSDVSGLKLKRYINTHPYFIPFIARSSLRVPTYSKSFTSPVENA